MKTPNSRSRREMLNGREHIVVPMTILVRGVLRGEDERRVLCHEDDFRKHYDDWNNVPILLNHAYGRTPEICDGAVGRIFNTRDRRRQLLADGWFDLDNMVRRAPAALAEILRGNEVGVSAGIFCKEDGKSGVHNGVDYHAIAKEIRPDHLVLCVKGACPAIMGCAVNNVRFITPKPEGESMTLEELIRSDRRRSQKSAVRKVTPLGLPTMLVEPLQKPTEERQQPQRSRPASRKPAPLGLPTMIRN